MKGVLIGLCAALCLVSEAIADEPLAGINVVNPQWLGEAAQAETLKALHDNGVTTVRVPLTTPYDKSKKFIEQAANSGLEVLIIVQINDRRALRDGARVRRGGKRTWDLYPLTDVDVAKFKANFAKDLSALEAAGVRAVGFEVGNEINWAPYNGDLAIGNRGRRLGKVDLAQSGQSHILRSFDHYLEMVKAVKELRDHSRLNKETPIISAGLADVHEGRFLSKSGFEVVSIDATLGYLREHGLDSLVDAYGIHTYPNIRQPWARQESGRWNDVLKDCGVNGGKPCWVTEWGYLNRSPACAVDDSRRADLVGNAKKYLESEEAKGRIQRAFYFNWNTRPFKGKKGKAFWRGVYRCGKLMAAGQALLSD